jgi:hypothetical protein
MSDTTQDNSNAIIKFAAVATAVGFLYAAVLAKLGLDWWTDENYSHGLLVPVVIAIIIWKEWDAFRRVERRWSVLLGGIAILFAILLLVAGTLGAAPTSLRHLFRNRNSPFTIYHLPLG